MTDKEQTTLRLDGELYKRLTDICEAEKETLSDVLRDAAKRICKRYRFDERGKLVSPR